MTRYILYKYRESGRVEFVKELPYNTREERAEFLRTMRDYQTLNDEEGYYFPSHRKP